MPTLHILIEAPKRKGKVAPWLGLNDYTAACRTSKYVGAELKKKYTTIAYVAAHNAKVRAGWKTPKGKVHVTCVWYEKDKRRDPDNIASGIKFVLDGLVEAKVIQNDSQKYIADMPMHLLRYNKYQPGVEVTVTTIDEEQQ